MIERKQSIKSRGTQPCSFNPATLASITRSVSDISFAFSP